MDKTSRNERNIRSPEDKKRRHKRETLPSISSREENPENSSKHFLTDRMETERNFRKQSKIHDLLNSVKDDVVQMKEHETSHDEIQTDPSSIPGQSNFQRNFIRVSPQKTSGNDSKWKKAVRLSRIMMSPLQSLSRVSKDFKTAESDDETEEVSNVKMISLLKIIDHGGCIASGILTGLLLWSTINAVRQSVSSN